MSLQYVGLSEINGPLVVLDDVDNASYDEVVEIRLDDINSKAVGEIQFNTDRDFKVITAELPKNISGVHDLYFVFGGNFVFDQWQFAYLSNDTVQ